MSDKGASSKVVLWAELARTELCIMPLASLSPSHMAHRHFTHYPADVTTSRKFLATACAAVLLAVTSCGGDDEAAQRGSDSAPLDGGGELNESEEGDAEEEVDAPEAEPELPEPAEGFEEIAERLDELPGRVEALVIEDGETLLQRGDSTAAPLASVSKLYVLAALAEAVESGDAEWMDSVTVTDELRSLPSGTLQDQADGYSTTLFDVAHRMISISDNTGTDMVMDLLGREAVEEAVAEFGHHDPQQMQPFLTTQELFQLRWGLPELGEGWAELDESQRREVLSEVEEEDFELTSEDTSRHDLDFAIDWHASAEDIAALHTELIDRAESDPELSQVLTANGGLPEPVEDPWWDELSFKGGGVPGVVTGSWHAQAEDGTGRTVVILLSTEDTEDIADHRTEVFALALDALIAGTDTVRESDAEDSEEDDDAAAP